MIQEIPHTRKEIDKRLRIFVDAHCFDGEYQGSRTFIKEIYSALSHKPDIILFLAACNIENLKRNFSGSGNVRFIKYKSHSPYMRLLYDIPFLIKKHRIEFAHFQYIAPLIKNCKQIITIHDVLFNDYPDEFPAIYKLTRRYLFQKSAKHADILTTVSDYSKAAIRKHFPGSRNIHVIPNGVDAKFFEAYDKQEAKDFIYRTYGLNKFILFVSRIEPRKNHVLVLKSYLELKLYEKGYHLALVGYTKIPVPELTRMLNALKPEIRKFIFLHEAIDDNALLQLYRAADLFVYPSKAEGFGLPPVEAAAARIPVICSNSTAMAEFSFFGENHIDPTDDESFKERLKNMVERNLSEEELNNRSQQVYEKYSWECSAEKLYQLCLRSRNSIEINSLTASHTTQP